ncbi:hypothetical protein GUITHDRAFT_110312 [Guillardia theta CCMP2712]|uniref:RRM domain-containing protein n=1 Tax=Guillardia theta (strain CCMP2712) TaxID=905079 RepID=L1J6C7_GUITC|nr:hypothetical protein GUITHDRAFT_110312 [Guillardia theta CCMP2712]EKX43862.1 hypothetical protein GUITHDRAFT_110312 [Guillardia theta CCMP2712]|eukprot:XP_005830842.1 hypothetical protein GUITHDRAFT_110312 [Guillardia theta CCMP2712]
MQRPKVWIPRRSSQSQEQGMVEPDRVTDAAADAQLISNMGGRASARERPPPQDSKLAQRSVFLGNTGDLQEWELWVNIERLCGEIDDLVVIRDQVTDEPKGYAFVMFASSAQAMKCISHGPMRIREQIVFSKMADREFSKVRNTQTGKTNKVFLGGTRQLIASELLPVLRRFGEVVSCDVIKRQDNILYSAGFAFVTYATPQEARRIVNRGFIVVKKVRIEVRYAAEESKNLVSNKVTLAEVNQLIRDLVYEIERVSEFAPGGYLNATAGDSLPPDDDASISCKENQVFDCLCERARQASINGELDLLKSVVAKGADVCAPPRARAQLPPNLPLPPDISYDPYAPRCLFFASSRGHAEICRFLLSVNSSDVDAVSSGGELHPHCFYLVNYTPLKAAAENGHAEVVSLLLARIDSCSAPAPALSPSLSVACRSMVQTSCGCSAGQGRKWTHRTKKAGNSPLYLAVKAKAWEAVRVLIEEFGADPNLKNRKGKTAAKAILRARESGRPE